MNLRGIAMATAADVVRAGKMVPATSSTGWRPKRHGTRKDWIVRGSKKEAEAFEARKRLEIEAADPELDPRVVPTFSDFCAAQYRPHAEVHLKGNTWYKRSSLLSFLMEHFGSLKLTEIHARAVDDYKRKRREDGLKNVSINNELRVLRIVLNFAARERKLAVADVHIRLLEESERRVRAWTREEIDRLLAAVRDESSELLPIVVCRPWRSHGRRSTRPRGRS